MHLSDTIRRVALCTALLLSPLIGSAAETGAAVLEDVRYLSAGDQTEQPALFFDPKRAEAVPLLVALHTWSGDYKQVNNKSPYFEWCVREGWAMIHPNFRGPNNTPEACGSDLAVQDIFSAVEFAKKTTAIDPKRIYVIGASGGGHMAMLMAGRAPQMWAGVSAWCGISDLSAWHAHHSRGGRKSNYARMLESACGGAPGASPEVDERYRVRSPVTWLAKASAVPLDISTGITDGFKGSVPVSHSLRAFNVAAAPADRIPEPEIESIAAQPEMPAALRQTVDDPQFVGHPALYRRVSGNTRVTIFQGGHEIIPNAGLTWLARQKQGQPADWSVVPLTPGNTPAGAVESGK